MECRRKSPTPLKAMRFPTVVSVLSLTCLAATPSGAATILKSLPSDASAGSSGTVVRVADTAVTAGFEGGQNVSAVLVFELPTLLPGQTIANATFSTRIVNNTSSLGTGNLDLYGLNFRSSSAVLGSDYFSGALDASAGATLLRDNYAVTTANGTVTANAATRLNLTNYLNAQILAGAGSGSYIFLRLSNDVEPLPTATSFFFVGSNTNTTLEPTLTFDIIPEPSSLLLGGLGGLALAIRRRRA